MPVSWESTVAIGTPPSSSPPRASVSDGTRGTSTASISCSSAESASNRYLSKCSLLTATDLSTNSPVMCDVAYTDVANWVRSGVVINGRLSRVHCLSRGRLELGEHHLDD